MGDEASTLSVFDFKVALALCGLLCALSIWPFSTLKRDAGQEISGHKTV